MDRRKVLLAVAAVIAALGTLLVFLYVRGADTRADERYEAVQVLRAVKQIEPGETVEAAQAAGKFETSSVSQKDLLPEALTTTEGIAGMVAVSTIYPKEQLTSSKFGATGAAASGLTIPKGKVASSVDLQTDPVLAGFVNPGDKVAIFLTEDLTRTRLLLPSIQVISVGATTEVATTATEPAGGEPADPAAAEPAAPVPNTLLTVAVTQSEHEQLQLARTLGQLSYALLNNDSKVAASKGVTKANLFKAP